MSTRRELLIALGAGALSVPLSSFAQQLNKVWRVGMLSQAPPPGAGGPVPYNGFVRGMRDLGYIEGKNLEIELRFADNKVERLPELAAELVRAKVDVIMASGTPGTGAAQKATATIPIVMANAGDPVGSGFIASLARPGGNITGLTNLAVELGPKFLDLLLRMAPRFSRVAMLVNPTNAANVAVLQNVAAAAKRFNVKILPVNATTVNEIEDAFSRLTRENAGALIVPGDTLFNLQAHQIAALALKNRLPSICAFYLYAEVGGLMSYASNAFEQNRRAATYVDKILKGAKPGDLPVEQPTKFDLVINGKTAKALGITIPQSMLVQANKVIE